MNGTALSKVKRTYYLNLTVTKQKMKGVAYMQDLNANVYYKAKFQISLKEDYNEDLLWKLVWNIKNWITHKLNREETIIENSTRKWSAFKTGGRFYDLQGLNRVYAESVFYQPEDTAEHFSWACKIVEKPITAPDYIPREWITQIGYQAISQREANISYIVTYNDYAGFIGFQQETPVITVPKVVRWLMNDAKLTCSIGKTLLSYDPIQLNVGDYPAFEQVLYSQERDVPLIYISPYYSDEDHEAGLLVDPKKLAESVAASALVYYSDSLDFAAEMAHMGKADYYCGGGAIRVYRPHINLYDEWDHRQHRYLTPSFITEQGEDAVLQMLRRALAQNISYYEDLFRIDDCRALIDTTRRKARIRELQEHQARSQNDANEAFELWETAEREKEEIIRELNETRNALDNVKSSNYVLKARLEELEPRAGEAAKLLSSLHMVRSVSEYPKTPLEVAKYFEMLFPDKIAFTERAYKSLKGDCITKVDILWNIFYYMATELTELKQQNPATAYDDFHRKTGWECSRGEGKMTRDNNALMRNYKDVYNGKKIDIEPHVKNGNRDTDSSFVRVHFAYDEQSGKIIIGHCGKHLPNYGTQKARR